MSLCIFCGVQLSGAEGLCLHHERLEEHGWAAVNRVMCNLFHRGIVPARLPLAERDADDREPRGEAA
jgi:hypothetical protein